MDTDRHGYFCRTDGGEEMSASIYYTVPRNGIYIPCNTPSAFVSALELPRQFDRGHVAFLRGVAKGRPDWEDAINEICEAISIHNSIEVYAEY